MLALAIILVVALMFTAVAYGRAIVYAFSEEYQLEQRIKGVTKS